MEGSFIVGQVGSVKSIKRYEGEPPSELGSFIGIEEYLSLFHLTV
jgi:hypothetical protein